MNNIKMVLIYAFLLLGVSTQVVQIFMIVPLVRRYKAKSILDFIPGTHQFKNLKKYKEICENNKLSLFWYRFQIAVLISLFILMIILFIGDGGK